MSDERGRRESDRSVGEMRDEVKGWTSLTRDMIYLVLLVAAGGYAWARFEAVETKVEAIMVQEADMASAADVQAVSERLRRWIDRYNANDESKELREALQQLELYIAATHGEVPR